jgi:pyridoxamine 5'-phosphate oxidase
LPGGDGVTCVRVGQDGVVTRHLPDLPGLRHEYPDGGTLTEGELADDWPTQFGAWFADAIAAGEPEPNAMVLATADAAGRPSARTVLLKGFDADGFVWYTNLGSRKAQEARANPYGSLVFRWLRLHRQVVVCGTVSEVSRSQTERYFAQRPRGARLGAWASPQSQVLAARADLLRRYAEAAARFPEEVPAPPHWGGLRLAPESVEFWQGRPDRLHDRLRLRRIVDGVWDVERLAP